jgi:hypothetical protein
MLKIGGMGLASLLCAAVAAAGDAPLERRFEPGYFYDDVLEAQALDPVGRVERVESGQLSDAAPAFKPSEYWLGIECMIAPSALRAQLGLAEKQGLLVGNVVPESPAAKAGIARHDVLLRAGDRPLGEPRDLVQAVENAKQSKLKIDLIRGGKPKTVEALPAKRPQEASRAAVAPPEAGDRAMIQRWMDNWWRDRVYNRGGEQSPMQFFLMHPGAIVSGDVLLSRPLPPNMSIVVSKEGDQPAKIVVKREDKKWEVTEKELDKLPADVRPHVERMLGRGLTGIIGAKSSADALEGLHEDMRRTVEKDRVDMDKQAQDMDKQSQEIRQALEAAQKQHDAIQREFKKLDGLYKEMIQHREHRGEKKAEEK